MSSKRHHHELEIEPTTPTTPGASHENRKQIEILEEKLHDVQKKLENISGFQLHKLRNPRGLSNNFQQSNTDPYLYLELELMRAKYNNMVKKVAELEALNSNKSLSNTKSTVQDDQIKILEKENNQLKHEKHLISSQLKDSNIFIEKLKKQLINTKLQNKNLEEENSRLQAQLLLYSQAQPLSLDSNPYFDATTNSMDVIDQQPLQQDYIPSPVLVVDEY